MAIVETVIELWNGWEIRVLVLLSLSLQVILIAFGSKRKSTTSTWINFLVWSAYLSADWVATVALGILARSLGSNAPNQNHSLQSFWAPFLLLHLGGPDTITAYSLEDNELWPRHLVGLVFETGVAIYVLLRSWVDGDTTFSCIAIPVFIAGIIKYGERTYVLMSSSTKQFRSSSLDDLLCSYLEIYEGRPEAFPAPVSEPFLLRVDRLFRRLKFLYADHILDQTQQSLCNDLIRDCEARKAFELVEFELGLLYDLLYTKASLVYSCFGIFFRCITCLASVSALVTFSIIIDEPEYSPVDIIVTYLLLVGAVFLEVYALLMLASSDWLKVWLVAQRKCRSLQQVPKYKRWSRGIAKCNLVSFCHQKEATMWIKVQRLLGIYEMLEKHQTVEWQQGIDDGLKKLIFDQLYRRSEELGDFSNSELCNKVLNYRGECVLNEIKLLDELKLSTVDVEFDESVLLWHIATQLCYYDDMKTADLCSLNEYSKISRCLSEYMLYLLVLRSEMLPKGIGEIRHRRACEEVLNILKEKRGTEIKKAYQELFEEGAEVGRFRSEDFSILPKGYDIAKQLQNLNERDRGREEKWEMMNKVWVELLTYAAGHCGWKEHGRQLAKGGQLLTHVCLLMAHFGISGQYRAGRLYYRLVPSKRYFNFSELSHAV